MYLPGPVLSCVLQRAGLVDLSRLVLPVWCPGCGRPDVVVCVQCAAPMLGPARSAHEIVGAAPPWWRGLHPPISAVCAYSGPVRRVLVAWKDRARRDLDPLIVHTLTTACRHAVTVARRDVGPHRPIAIVPVPSLPRSSRRRGGWLLRQALAQLVPDLGGPTFLLPAVVMSRGARDQVGLTAHARRDNVSGRFRLVIDPPPTAVIVLVDDIVTTGASLAETARALPRANLVLGAAVSAVTPAPGT